jgi:predicted amidohydrolase YtcJ
MHTRKKTKIALQPCFSLLLLLFASSAFAQQSARVAPADIIIQHAKVFTADEKHPWAQSLAIYKGKIVAVGTDDEVTRRRGIGTKMIDAGGKVVLPGFTDCHVHFLSGGLGLHRVNLEGAKNLDDILVRLQKYADAHPDTPWILGRGWNYAMFAPDTLPNKKPLDKLFPAWPIFLRGYDGHTSWVNSKALALAGITKDTPNPPNGEIVRDPATGEATGALKESASALVEKVIPKPDHVAKLNAYRSGMRLAIQQGITRVHSAGGDFEELATLDELRGEKQLWLRVSVAYLLQPPELRPEDLKAIEDAHKQFHDDWLDVNTVKFLLDGVIESHTAAMLQPYTDDPSKKGSLFWDPEKYKAAVAELDKHGFQIYTHAIGDYAVRTALDGYEFAHKKNKSKDRRDRVEHVETIDPADIPRFAKLGAIASMQPLHSYPDADTLDVWARNIGTDRASRAWVWKSIAQAGGDYAFGSDWPVVTLNPWEGIQTAVTRQTSDGNPRDGFIPSQKLSVPQAVQAYTLGAALAGHHEKMEGSIEKGKWADVIMIDRNIFEIEPHTIDKTQVVLTIVGGKIVYEADH